MENPKKNQEKLNLSILVADDEDYNRELLGEVLNEKYLRVEIVDSGETLLNKLDSNQKYNFIILDNTMGEGKIKGVEVLEKIRSMQSYYNIPVIILTGDMSDEVKSRVVSLRGIYMDKPFNIDDLHHKILDAIV